MDKNPVTKFKISDARGFLIACCGITLILSVVCNAVLIFMGKLSGEIGLQVFLGVFTVLMAVGSALGVAKRANDDD